MSCILPILFILFWRSLDGLVSDFDPDRHISDYDSGVIDSPFDGNANQANVDIKHVPSIQELETRFSWLLPGGHGRPQENNYNESVAIVVPYRCRAKHLLLFLQHMHNFLQRQQVDYTIFVVEQAHKDVFNRAKLMNIGYVEALKMRPFDCFIFHDIDLLPEDLRNMYGCHEQPRHMSVAIDIFNYTLPSRGSFGGVSAINAAQFKELNGFSNIFWGWGGEDDDMTNRIRYRNFHISRYPNTFARYVMLAHKKQHTNSHRLLKQGRMRYTSEGLNSLHYAVLCRKKQLLYTWLLVKLRSSS